ncbi:DNA-binding protein [Actinoplanes sp. NPDC023936]|uniref:helix-turn-helix transcriptional regulator n=1 Tax=Actinoplanes sp. NPDC023936 TaxID=3154910 RepID=UPI0033CAD946
MSVKRQAQLFMGTHEIGVRLGGVSRQRVYQLTNRPNFPAPIADLAQGRVWLAADVESWIARYRKQKE